METIKLFDLLGQEVLNGDYIKSNIILQVLQEDNGDIILYNPKLNNNITKKSITKSMFKSEGFIERIIAYSIKLTKYQIKRFKKINNLSE